MKTRTTPKLSVIYNQKLIMFTGVVEVGFAGGCLHNRGKRLNIRLVSRTSKSSES